MPVEIQDQTLNDLQDFLTEQLGRAVSRIEGVPQEVKETMKQALKGSLDYVINDIHPEGDGVVDFFTMIPEFSMTVGENIREGLSNLEFTDELMIDTIINAVGHEFSNPSYWNEGPQFENITKLPELVLLEGQQVAEIMRNVRDGIVSGVRQVVEAIPMEEKYQRAAFRAMQDEMMHVAAQFDHYMDMAGTAGAGTGGAAADAFFFDPEPWTTAVCCMKGMDCFDGDFANAAGRASLEAELARFEGMAADAKEYYDELNVENLRKATEEREASLNNSRTLSNKLVNNISDTEKRLTKRTTEIAAVYESSTAEE
jgi:hypothetical protein